MYLISRIGVKATANQNILEAVSARLALLMGPWVLGVDANCTPQELIDTGWLAVVKGKVVYPSGKTCTAGVGRTIDFFVISLDMDPYVVGAFNITDAGTSPHSPVRLIVSGKPRDDGMRCIKVPASHRSDLPEGPHQKCIPVEVEDCTEEQLGMDYPGCIRQLEKELNMIAGLDDDASAHFCGRARGPEFVWKQAGGKAASAKTTSASRAWRLSAMVG